MYKIFDTPKNKYDIVNKDYVDKILVNSGSYSQNLSVEIYDNNWIQDNDVYYFILEHNLESINLIINCYNDQNEISNIYYKLIDNNNILFISEAKRYMRIVINHSTNAQTIPDDIINIITTLQEKVFELENRMAVLEGSIVKIESIKISGPNIIYI